MGCCHSFESDPSRRAFCYIPGNSAAVAIEAGMSKDVRETKSDPRMSLRSKPSTFLGLVRELCNQIYDCVLTSSASRPTSPSTSGARKQLKSLGFERINDERTTFFPTRPISRPGSALLRTCHGTRSTGNSIGW